MKRAATTTAAGRRVIAWGLRAGTTTTTTTMTTSMGRGRRAGLVVDDRHRQSLTARMAAGHTVVVSTTRGTERNPLPANSAT